MSTTQENVKVVRQMFEAWNAHEPDRLVKLLDEKYMTESDTVPAPIHGREATRQFMQVYIKAFPDLHLDVIQILADGEFVVSRWTGKGTHRGEFMGLPATNRRGIINGCTVSQVRGGKIVHEWLFWDTGHLMKQLGVTK
jgi:steroid delta-isomerase-like uncharacterized protein